MSGHTLLKEYTTWKAVSQKLAMRWACVKGRAAENPVNLQKASGIKKKDNILMAFHRGLSKNLIQDESCYMFARIFGPVIHISATQTVYTFLSSLVMVQKERALSWFLQNSKSVSVRCRRRADMRTRVLAASQKNYCCSMQFFYFAYRLVQIPL